MQNVMRRRGRTNSVNAKEVEVGYFIVVFLLEFLKVTSASMLGSKSERLD